MPHRDPCRDWLLRWQQSGDEEALDELLRFEVRLLKERIRRGGWGGIDPSASVSDVAQDAVMKLLSVEDSPRFDEPQAFRAYLWRAAWHLLVDRMRQRGRVGRISLDGSGAVPRDPSLETSGGLGAVERADGAVSIELGVQLLGENERRIIELVYFRKLGIGGAAEELGIAHDAAKARLVRARRKLAGKLKGWAELIG